MVCTREYTASHGGKAEGKRMNDEVQLTEPEVCGLDIGVGQAVACVYNGKRDFRARGAE